MPESPPNSVKKFPVETNFQKKARRPGGLARSQAVEAATAELKELGPEYRVWLADETASLANSIDALWEASEAFAMHLEAAEQHCRRIRDVAGTMDFDLVTFVAASLREILKVSRHDMQARREPIACHIDALRLVSRDEYEGKTPDEIPHFTEGLRQVAAYATSCPHCIMRTKAANQNSSSSES